MVSVKARKSHQTGVFKRLGASYQQAKQALTPGARAWHGAAWGALAALTLILLTAAFSLFGQASPSRFLIGAAALVATFAILGLLLTLVWRLLRAIPAFYVWALACALPVLGLLVTTAISMSVGIILTGLGVLALASLLGASLGALTGRGWHEAGRLKRTLILSALVVSLAGLISGSAWLLDPGSPLIVPPNAAALSGAKVEPLALPDPSQPGSDTVRTLFYGSGHDRQRPEYGTEVDLVTQPVDGSTLVDGWSSLRTDYWGFSPQALPLNGRVWYPAGEGPFPLVVIVHGQHPMEDFSDPGYAYLGELLASRGFIVASVDENFLNLSPLVDLLVVQSLSKENDLRGWLLLEHLKVWQAWNTDPGSPFYQKVDMNQIALIGHSRGGEAVAVAAAFNQLPANPDDARLRFDYNFNIRAVVGIAPVDGTYQPGGRDVTLENINYLVLHGAQDMDVFTFQGSRQYARVRFTRTGDGFKAAVYTYGANHGQFNTVWGRKDLFEPIMRVFNLEQLMPAEDQQQVAKATISAFLEASLHGQTGYRAFFQDLRRGNGWLPGTLYLHQYEDANTRLVSTYEEDINLATATLPGAVQAGEHLTLWREQPVRARWNNLSDQAVYLGWDTAVTTSTARYAVRLPEDSPRLAEGSILVFSLADANENPLPERKGKNTPDHRDPIDLTVEVVDRNGQTARLPLSHFSLLQPQLEGRLGKAPLVSPFPTSEAVLQHFEFPLQDFASANPAFHPAELAEVRFLFDRTPAGVVVLDNIGLRPEK